MKTKDTVIFVILWAIAIITVGVMVGMIIDAIPYATEFLR